MLCGTLTLVRPRQNGQCLLSLGSPALCYSTRRHFGVHCGCDLPLGATTNCFAMCLLAGALCACGCLPTVPAGRYSARGYAGAWLVGGLSLVSTARYLLCACTLMLGVRANCCAVCLQVAAHLACALPLGSTVLWCLVCLRLADHCAYVLLLTAKV